MMLGPYPVAWDGVLIQSALQWLADGCGSLTLQPDGSLVVTAPDGSIVLEVKPGSDKTANVSGTVRGLRRYLAGLVGFGTDDELQAIVERLMGSLAP